MIRDIDRHFKGIAHNMKDIYLSGITLVEAIHVLEVDHKSLKSDGGTDAYDNLKLLCLRATAPSWIG